MRAWFPALLLVVTSAFLHALPQTGSDRLQRCDRVCRDSLVPCGKSATDVTVHRFSSAVPSCSQVRGLARRQRAFCRRNRDLLPSLLEGMRRGTAACRRRFQRERWNCHALGQHLEFGHVQVKGTREAAVMYALQSAGVAFSLYAACRRGTLASCSCGAVHAGAGARAHTLQRWKWSGCPSGLEYSARKARAFVNGRETEGDGRSRVNVHNNKVGVKVVSRRGRHRSACHGLSGSCTMVVRWRQYPASFSAIAATLAAKRDKSALVTLSEEGKLQTAPTGARPGRQRLVHLEPSPSYCEPDPETGFEGTVGRPCRRNSSVAGSCARLCCDRGHTSRVVHQVFCCNYHANPVHPTRCQQRTRLRTCR